MSIRVLSGIIENMVRYTAPRKSFVNPLAKLTGVATIENNEFKVFTVFIVYNKEVDPGNKMNIL